MGFGESAGASPGHGERHGAKILIIDDEIAILDSLSELLSSQSYVVETANSGTTAIKKTLETNPDVILLDLAIPQDGGLEVLRQLRSAGLHAEVIVLCGSGDPPERLQALRHGARGVILKTDKVKTLIEGIQKVADGDYWIGSDGVKSLVHSIVEGEQDSHAGKNRYGLTKRECDVVLSVLEGFTNPEIAERFSLSEQTVKHHLSHIFDKLGVYSRLELALFAVNHHLFENGK